MLPSTYANYICINITRNPQYIESSFPSCMKYACIYVWLYSFYVSEYLSGLLPTSFQYSLWSRQAVLSPRSFSPSLALTPQQALPLILPGPCSLQTHATIVLQNSMPVSSPRTLANRGLVAALLSSMGIMGLPPVHHSVIQ